MFDDTDPDADPQPPEVTAQIAAAIGPDCTPYIDAPVRIALHRMLLAVPAQHMTPGELGAVYLLCAYNDGALLNHAQVRAHLSSHGDGSMWCKFAGIAARLDAATGGADDPLGIIGRTGRHVLEVCCGLYDGRPVAALGQLLVKLDRRNKAAAVVAVSLSAQLVMPVDGVIPAVVILELSTALAAGAYFAGDDLPVMHAAAAAVGLEPHVPR